MSEVPSTVSDLEAKPSTATSFCGINLNNCVYNASGALCTTAEELVTLYESEAGAVLTKSCTMESRVGNPEPRYFSSTTNETFYSFSINSMGIPNNGVDFYMRLAKELYEEEISFSPEKAKPFIISLSGLTVAENMQLLKKMELAVGISAIELNVSCPNIVGKPQLGYDFDGLRSFLNLVQQNYCKAVPLGLKLPPYFDFAQFEAVAEIIRDFPVVEFIVCSNSLGNGLWVDTDTETVVIKPKNGFGGVGGSAMKATTLANVHKFYELLGEPSLDKYPTIVLANGEIYKRNPVAIIGCGGVITGKDVFDLVLCGASAVQIGTQFMLEGVTVFDSCSIELGELMAKKGYTCLSDFRGKLKYIK